jgi:hypothetical protein
MAALIPAQSVAPANIGQAWQPARAAALGIPSRDPGAVQGFIGAALGRQEVDKMQKKRAQGGLILADLPIELLRVGSCGKAARSWRCA